MPASSLTALFIHIERMPAQDLQCLDDENEDWLPRLRTLRPEMIVQEIRRALEATPSVPECLMRVAWLYCWLISRQKICPWLLIRFNTNVMQINFHELIEDLANALYSSPQRYRALRVRHHRGKYYACIINNCADADYRECRVTFFVLWSGHPFAAAYAGTNEELRALTTAFHVALRGESVELLLGHHADLVSAYWASREDVDGTFLFRSERSNMAQHFWHFDDPEQAVDLSLATHRQGKTRLTFLLNIDNSR
ncbi:hypothetical protein HPB52_013459 [Rhipicephalus sanguineus]|uniref:Uncharacterized protein n=1 Tax=Rhipicephalus sanguineus TaxID=34632 RepID=A0A9D4PH50_RHISA|nr:hypothetical protein HPB52_013459 [Rhipicephalus sanguineus]